MEVSGRPLPFSLRQLQYVVAIEEQRSFSKAARSCRVSQPGLSSQVALLEEQLGVQIFERSRRGVVLTRAGEALIEQGRRILQASTEMCQMAEEARAPWSATWRFGIIPTLAPYVLPQLARSLRRVHPRLKIQWREATTPELVELVSAGKLEAAVLALEADLGSLSYVAVMRDPFVLAVARSHRWANSRRRIALHALDSERLLLLEDEHCLRQQALTVCRRSGAEGGTYEATSLPTLLEMVADGDGVTILPTVAVPAVRRDRRIRLLELQKPAPYRTIGLAWRGQSALETELLEVAELFEQGL
ncbi:MAG: LysR substrate-binding domain-containing protein [Myxococcota bacterium]